MSCQTDNQSGLGMAAWKESTGRCLSEKRILKLLHTPLPCYKYIIICAFRAMPATLMASCAILKYTKQ